MGCKINVIRALTLSLLFLWISSASAQNCSIENGLPDSACTTGAVAPDVPLEELCEKGYTLKTRNVSQALKNKVYLLYGIEHRKPREYEIDHCINLGINGSNEIENLWPQKYGGPLGAEKKDKLENFLRRKVCAGEITLEQAQAEICHNWIRSYKKYGLDKVKNRGLIVENVE